MNFTKQEIKIANATSRSNGASAINSDGTIRAIVPNFIYKNIDKYRNKTILDFGAGKDAIHTKWLKEQGLNIIAYDFGDNCVDGIHDKDALNKRYDVIFASNVLNVQSSGYMLLQTITQIYYTLKNGGEFIFNYPISPRKLKHIDIDRLKKDINEIFGGICVEHNKSIFSIIKKEDVELEETIQILTEKMV